VPFLMKQMSGKRPIPDDLNIRQFPQWPRPVTRVINIRGTHGSGKSTVVRELMRASKICSPIYGVLGRKRPEAYRLTMEGCPADTFVLGPYETACGGCDAVQPYALIPQLIEKYAARGSVVFEGALISSCWGAIGEALERRGRNAAVLFLDTPLEVCVERVNARRRARGDARAFDASKLAGKHARIARLKEEKAAAGRVQALSVSDATAVATIIGLLRPEA
jgi:hypothetical protein